MSDTTERKSPLQAAARYGLYTGLMLVLIQTIQYLAGLYVSFFFSILTGSLFIAAIVLSIRNYRENELSGWLNYGEGVTLGTLLSLAAALIYGAFMLLLVTVIDTTYFDELIIQTQEMMEASKVPDEVIEKTIDQMQENSSPLQFAYGPLIQYGVSGLIISLIVAIFFRKAPANSFEKDLL